MKKIKKIVSLCLAMVMCLGLSVTAASADGTGTITITNAKAGNTYNVYKVFNAAGDGTNISYKKIADKDGLPKGFKDDGAGNIEYKGDGKNGELTPEEIASIANYVKDDPFVKTATAAKDGELTIEGLDDGYYYITTTTGTVVTINSVNKAVSVEDKNQTPTIDKTTTDNKKNDIAGVGDSVPFTATIDVKKGAKNYVFKDTMTNMKFAEDAVIKVSVGGIEVADKDENGTNYTVSFNADRTELTIKFENPWIEKQVDNKITIKYSAIITSDALTTTPATNKAELNYGNGVENKSTPSEVVNVYNATITVNKKDGSNNSPLAGAFFVLQNKDGKYYKAVKDDAGNVTGIEWVGETKDADVLETTTDNGCKIEFKGLNDGTYTLIETKAPDGYNTAENKTITIEDGKYTENDLHKSVDVENNKGAQLPSTGGMGTTIFYVVGGIMVLGAAVLMVTKRRVNSAK